MNAYKVVYENKGHYYSTNNIFLPNVSNLCFRYDKEDIVIAPDWTMGLFIFKEKKDASHFIEYNFIFTSTLKHIHIKEVETLSPIIQCKKCICGGYFENSTPITRDLYRYLKNEYNRYPPRGTYLRRKLRVIS